MGASEAVIAVAGTATALLNVTAAWKASSTKETGQAAARASARDMDRTLKSLEGSIANLAGGIDGRFSDSQTQTTHLLDMYRDLVIRVLPPGSP